MRPKSLSDSEFSCKGVGEHYTLSLVNSRAGIFFSPLLVALSFCLLLGNLSQHLLGHISYKYFKSVNFPGSFCFLVFLFDIALEV